MSPTPPEIPGTTPAAAGMCVHHPDLRAGFVCSVCHQLICELCAFKRTDGSRICPQCASAAPAGENAPRIADQQGVAPPPRVHALKCLQHPNVSAVNVCKGCGAPMCAVCDFLFPVDLHLCPRCVASPPRRMSRQRKGLIITAYVFAVWGTIALGAVASGALRGLFESVQEQRALTMLLGLLVVFPAIIGGALGISCFDSRLRNPPSVWGAAIWNCLLLLIHVGLILIGYLAG